MLYIIIIVIIIMIIIIFNITIKTFRSALITACLANLFAAFKGNENAKLMTTPGIKASKDNHYHYCVIILFALISTDAINHNNITAGPP